MSREAIQAAVGAKCILGKCLSMFPHHEECVYLSGCAARWMLAETSKNERVSFPESHDTKNAIVEALRDRGWVRSAPSHIMPNTTVAVTPEGKLMIERQSIP